jgi:single-strand DNA-binding protein
MLPVTGVNKVILIGNAGENAELKFTASGKPVANFSVAVNEWFKNGNGEKVERVEWFRCLERAGRSLRTIRDPR